MRTPRTKKNTTKNTRRPPRRSRHRAAYEHAMAKGGWGADGERSLTAAIEARQKEETLVRRQRLNPHLFGMGALIVAFCAACVAAGAWATGALPVAFGAVVVLAVSATVWWRLRVSLGQKVWATGVIAVFVLATVAAIGVSNQRVTTSGVVLHGSRTDRILDQIDMLKSDLDRLAFWDELAGLDAPGANSRLNDIASAKGFADALAADRDDTWETPELATAAEDIRQAAEFAGVALDARYNLALQYDDRLAANWDAARRGLATRALVARQLIQTVEQQVTG